MDNISLLLNSKQIVKSQTNSGASSIYWCFLDMKSIIYIVSWVASNPHSLRLSHAVSLPLFFLSSPLSLSHTLAHILWLPFRGACINSSVVFYGTKLISSLTNIQLPIRPPCPPPTPHPGPTSFFFLQTAQIFSHLQRMSSRSLLLAFLVSLKAQCVYSGVFWLVRYCLPFFLMQCLCCCAVYGSVEINIDRYSYFRQLIYYV